MFTDYDNFKLRQNAQESNATEVKENHTEFTDTVIEHLFTSFFFSPKMK